MGNSSYPEPWENILAAATISIFSAPSLILYILIVQVLIQNPRVFSKNPYYTLLSSLAVSDTTMLVLYLFYAVPCTLARCHIFGAGFDVAIGVVFNTAYFAGISCIALIAINRYWAVCRFINYDRTFSRRNVKILICFAWTAGGVSGAFQAFPCCHLRYSFTAYSWLYDMTQFGNAYYVWLDRGLNLTVFAVLAICYTAILYARFGSSTQAYLSCNQQSRRKFAERSLALQFGIIVLVLFVAGLSFTIIPELSQNHWLMLLVSVFYIINNGCNPYVYLAFNKKIRSHFLRMFCNCALDEATKNVVTSNSKVSSQRIVIRRASYLNCLTSDVYV